MTIPAIKNIGLASDMQETEVRTVFTKADKDNLRSALQILKSTAMTNWTELEPSECEEKLSYLRRSVNKVCTKEFNDRLDTVVPYHVSDEGAKMVLRTLPKGLKHLVDCNLENKQRDAALILEPIQTTLARLIGDPKSNAETRATTDPSYNREIQEKLARSLGTQ